MPRRARTIVVPHGDLVGRSTLLRVRRLGPAGAALAPDHDDGDAPTEPDVLLPKREVPAGTVVGDELAVFVALDSEDRPVATTRVPKLQLGEVAFLAITAITEVGVFVDWGLPKELLVPFREQTRDLQVGERHPVGLFVDKTGRLAGTMRVSEMLRATPTINAAGSSACIPSRKTETIRCVPRPPTAPATTPPMRKAPASSVNPQPRRRAP